jgi:hypothetical protein
MYGNYIKFRDIVLGAKTEMQKSRGMHIFYTLRINFTWQRNKPKRLNSSSCNSLNNCGTWDKKSKDIKNKNLY